MTGMFPHSAKSDAMIVERPREGDAIGLALRDAYADDQALPDDLAGLLRQLQRDDRRSAAFPGH
jgi:hypothetical protein